MSIHGNQYLLPLFMKEGTQIPFLQDDDELTFAFHLLTKDLERNYKILSFSRLLWPFLSIPGVISTHIILDGVKIFSKKGKFTNPPRKPLIGHILRNIDNRSHIEQLERIIDVLSYKDQEAEELSKDEESEYQAFQIQSLVNPEFLSTLDMLIPRLQYAPIESYVPLDTSLTTEQALDISEKYRGIIDTLKGNAQRWESQVGLIGEKVDKWLIDLNVELKDVESRYKSQIKKTSQAIDGEQVREKLELEEDKIEQWKLNEKKRLIDNLATKFTTLDQHFEEILKKNRFYSNADVLKRKSFENLIPSVEAHFSYLYENISHLQSDLSEIKQNFEEIKQRASKIDLEAQNKLKDIKENLDKKLLTRDQEISKFESEKEQKIQEISQKKQKIEDLFNQIKNIIFQKKQDCLNEAEDLKNWSLEDNEKELFAKPIQWIYMPFYAMFVEDEDMMEEYMKIIFPGYILPNSKDSSGLYKEASEALVGLRDFINEKIEDDMRIRSNFEFASENKNLLNDPTIEKQLQKGLAMLRNKKIIDENIDQTIRADINKYIK
jgi:hypothetical protein